MVGLCFLGQEKGLPKRRNVKGGRRRRRARLESYFILLLLLMLLMLLLREREMERARQRYETYASEEMQSRHSKA